MPNPRLLALYNLETNETTPEQTEKPTIDSQPIVGQHALQIQPYDAEENDHPYDVEARKLGWSALHSGEVYNAQISKDSHVFIVLNQDETWEAWRETWKPGVLQSVSTKMIAKGVPFKVALQKATNYAQAILKYRR